MKTKFATFYILFFAIFSSFAEEATVVHKYAGHADAFYRRTLGRIAEGWVGTRENFNFALQSLKDKAVKAEQEAKVRAKITYDNVRNEAARKTEEITTDVRNRVTETGEVIYDTTANQVRKAGKTAKETGEVIYDTTVDKAQKTGKAIKRTGQKIGNSTAEMGEVIYDAAVDKAQKTGKTIQKTGRNVKERTKQGIRNVGNADW